MGAHFLYRIAARNSFCDKSYFCGLLCGDGEAIVDSGAYFTMMFGSVCDLGVSGRHWGHFVGIDKVF